MNELFRNLASKMSYWLGTPWAFITAFFIIIVWLLTGPIFGFSDTWQLVINTGTTIITFLMVFLIQNTQNRDAKAIHLKLDELIRGMRGARNGLVDLEDLSDAELDQLQQEFRKIREKHGDFQDQLIERIERVEDIAEAKVEEKAEKKREEQVEKTVSRKIDEKLGAKKKVMRKSNNNRKRA